MDTSRKTKSEVAIPEFLSFSGSFKQLYRLIMQAPVAIAVYLGPNFIVEIANAKMLEFYGKPLEEIINRPIFEVFPEVAAHGVEALHRKVVRCLIASYL